MDQPIDLKKLIEIHKRDRIGQRDHAEVWLPEELLWLVKDAFALGLRFRMDKLDVEWTND